MVPSQTASQSSRAHQAGAGGLTDARRAGAAVSGACGLGMRVSGVMPHILPSFAAEPDRDPC